MSAIAAVKYIADNVQFINDRVLDELRNGDDESIGTANFDDAVDDIVDIGGAVVILISFGVIEQLIDDVGKIVGMALRTLERVYLLVALRQTCTKCSRVVVYQTWFSEP